MIMKCLFVYNPRSGKCKQSKYQDYIVSKLKTKYDTVDVCPTEYRGHAEKLARNSCGCYDLLVVAGGDGTLNEIVNGIAEQQQQPLVGYIPQGTVNDVGHSLRIPRRIKKAVSIILNGKPFAHDIFKANDRYGIYVCCAGLFTETSYATDQNVKKAVGKAAYFFHGLKKVFSTECVQMDFVFDGGHIEGCFAFLLVLNSRNVGSFGINRKAKLDDGLVDVVLVKDRKEKVSLSGIARVFSIFTLGFKHRLDKNIITLRLDQFHATVRSDTVINLDGEKSSEGSFTFTVIPKGVQILVPCKKK